MTHRVNHILRNSRYGIKYSCAKRQLKSIQIHTTHITNSGKQGSLTDMQLVPLVKIKQYYCSIKKKQPNIKTLSQIKHFALLGLSFTFWRHNTGCRPSPSFQTGLPTNRVSLKARRRLWPMPNKQDSKPTNSFIKNQTNKQPVASLNKVNLISQSPEILVFHSLKSANNQRYFWCPQETVQGVPLFSPPFPLRHIWSS